MPFGAGGGGAASTNNTNIGSPSYFNTSSGSGYVNTTD